MEKYSKEWLTVEEIERLFAQPGLSSRDLLLMRVCYYGALRISEALNSNYEDYIQEDEKGYLILRTQKTDKRNWEKQPISLRIYSEVKRFCDDNKIKMQDRVFQSRENEKLTYSRAYQIVKECAKKSGIVKPITTHTFRRSRVQHLLDEGGDPFFVKEIARHKSIDTTRKYMKISKKKLADIMDNIDKSLFS